MVDKSKFAAEEALGYRITIVGRNLYVTDAMKNYAMEKISKIDRFHSQVLDVHVNLDIQKFEHSATIVLKFNHFKIKVSAVSTDMYASIDKAVDKLQAQLRRWKSRIQDHHKKPMNVIDMQVNVLQRPFSDLEEINAEIESANQKAEVDEYKPPRIIGSDKRPLKILSTDEAIMKMELSGDPFLLFRCEEDRKLKVIYRRNDGNYGLILAE
ncbi:MAG: ribosome-associated translation inhibitor RaiA [Verrucomicrobia bacterium]|nr:ribosome-associated translation inhibitor RaiA [Verrucomicrobiota bacterium]